MNESEMNAPGGASNPKVIYTILGVVIVVLLATTGYLLFDKQSQSNGGGSMLPPPPSVITPPPAATPPPPDMVSGDLIDVTWESKLIEQTDDCEPGGDCYLKKYLAGVIKNGEYKDQKLYMEVEYSLGAYIRYYVLSSGVPKYLPETAKFKGITDLPETIDFPGTNYKLKRGYRAVLFSEVKLVKKVFTHPTLGDFYLTQDGCLMIELPDHSAISYNFALPFINKETGSVNLTFNDGTKNKDNYTYLSPSCVAKCEYLTVVDEKTLKPSSRLVQIGKAGNGEDFYQIKEEQDPRLREIYNDKNTVAYFTDENGTQSSKNKYSYDEFIASHPLLYWKDPLGRWVEFRNYKFLVAAEMCKPAIYLYPTKTTNLEVKVYPTGGFTYTNPEYDGGWKVSATPEGKITDLKTGKSYGYLFWEGVGLNYPLTEEGWVVTKEKVSSFLDEMLPKLGMKGQEIIDFKEYWVARLSERPYYKLSFLKQAEFDLLAPLEVVGQKPDSVIRIMMTAEGLDAFKKVTPQKLEATPKRAGFTVLEWGGVLLR